MYDGGFYQRVQYCTHRNSILIQELQDLSLDNDLFYTHANWFTSILNLFFFSNEEICFYSYSAGIYDHCYLRIPSESAKQFITLNQNVKCLYYIQRLPLPSVTRLPPYILDVPTFLCNWS